MWTGRLAFVLCLVALPGVAASEPGVQFSPQQLAVLPAPQPGPALSPRASEPNFAPEWRFGAFPLHAAALRNDRNGIVQLIGSGFDPDGRDGYGKTPLMVAAAFGNTAAAMVLLDLGADIEAGDSRQARAVHYAARAGPIALDTLAALGQRGANVKARDSNGETPMHAAAGYNQPRAIRLLIELGADINARDHLGLTPLQHARREGRSAAISELIASGARADTLHDAVNAGDLARVRELLRSGADPDSRELGGTALHLAVARGDVAIAAALVDAGANVELAGDPSGVHPLHLAALVGEREAAALLVQSGADIEARDEEGRTPLMVAAAFSRTEVGKLLLSRGADIFAVDAKKMEVIHHAASSGDAELVMLLLERGVSANEKNRLSGMAPLHYAAGFGDLPVIALLARYGADFSLRDNNGSTPQDHANRCRASAAVVLIDRLATEPPSQSR